MITGFDYIANIFFPSTHTSIRTVGQLIWKYYSPLFMFIVPLLFMALYLLWLRHMEKKLPYRIREYDIAGKNLSHMTVSNVKVRGTYSRNQSIAWMILGFFALVLVVMVVESSFRFFGKLSVLLERGYV